MSKLHGTIDVCIPEGMSISWWRILVLTTQRLKGSNIELMAWLLLLLCMCLWQHSSLWMFFHAAWISLWMSTDIHCTCSHSLWACHAEQSRPGPDPRVLPSDCKVSLWLNVVMALDIKNRLAPLYLLRNQGCQSCCLQYIWLQLGIPVIWTLPINTLDPP